MGGTIKVEVGSKAMELNKTDQKRRLKNLVIFLAPVAIIYLTSIYGIIQELNHLFSLKDFIPTTFTQGAITAYVLNGLIDLIRKFLTDNTNH